MREIRRKEDFHGNAAKKQHGGEQENEPRREFPDEHDAKQRHKLRDKYQLREVDGVDQQGVGFLR